MTRIRQAFAEHPTAVTVLVGVGALLLISIAALLLIGLLGTRDGVADATATPIPESVAPSASASVEPSPSNSVDPSPSSTPAPEVAYAEVFAVEATADTPLRASAGGEAGTTTLPAGATALVVDLPQDVDGSEWYVVQHGEEFGWVSADDGTITLHRRLARSMPATTYGIDASTSGFIAWGASPRRSDAPMEGFVATSADGSSWQTVGVPGGEPGELFGRTATGGPNGWLLLGGNAEGTALGGAWRSDDGTAWEPIELTRSDGGDIGSLVPIELLGHANGYALVARDDSSGTSRHRLLTSADGIAWREQDVPIESTNLQMSPLGDGFLAWSETGDGLLFVRHSPDGDAWVDVAGDPTAGPIGSAPIIVEAAGVLVASTVDVGDGSQRWWTSPLPGTSGTLSWTEQPAVASQLGGAAIVGLAGDGSAALAFGRSFEDGHRQAWRTTDGTTWTEVDASALEERNASARSAVMREGVIVVLGFETTAAGPNPIFLRSSDGTAWEPAADATQIVESAVPGACPAPPTTMLEWSAIPGEVGAECFESSSVTFTAWRTEGGGCGGYTPGAYEPGWLAAPFATGALILLPYEAPTGGCGSVAAAPGVNVPDSNAWVEITGHWADAAASDCRYLPDPAAMADAIHADLEFHCRTVFVATEVVPASAP